MAIYNISFRIKQVGDHASRYESVVARIRAEAIGDLTWEETTSYFILESHKTAAALAESIYLNSDFMQDWDKMLVVNLSAKDQAAKGEFGYPATLNSLLSRR